MSSTSGGSENLRTLHVVFGPELARRSYMRKHGLENRDVLHWTTAIDRLQGALANVVLVDTYFQPNVAQWEEWSRIEHRAAVVATTSDGTIERVEHR